MLTIEKTYSHSRYAELNSLRKELATLTEELEMKEIPPNLEWALISDWLDCKADIKAVRMELNADTLDSKEDLIG